jgi:hypothetical protein
MHQQKGNGMKAVTVRQMPPAAAGVGKRAPERARHHDLDALAGVWSRAEADEFDRLLKAQRAIDADVWR